MGYNRHLKMGKAKLKGIVEITEQLDFKKGYCVGNLNFDDSTGIQTLKEPGEKVNINPDSAYKYVVVPKQTGCYADVSRWGNLGGQSPMFPGYSITYCDNNDIVIGYDAIYTDVFNNKYTRWVLKFPRGATKAYVTGCASKNLPPRVYKEVYRF